MWNIVSCFVIFSSILVCDGRSAKNIFNSNRTSEPVVPYEASTPQSSSIPSGTSESIRLEAKSSPLSLKHQDKDTSQNRKNNFLNICPPSCLCHADNSTISLFVSSLCSNNSNIIFENGLSNHTTHL